MKKEKQRTIYYETESDDFFTLGGSDISINEGYRYERRRPLERIFHFVAYRLLAAPAAFLYTKLKFREKFIGKSNLVAYKDRGYFLFANHTQPIADAFSPNVLTFPKHNSLIINKDNLALPVLGGALPYLGGIPLPDGVGAAKSFLECIKSRLDRGEAITVFPEAHVWSYYTGIRALNDAAFDLPVRFSAPVFAVTRVYRKGLFGVRCFIFIDGPFQPDQSLPKKEARKRLCRHVEAQMRERAALSNVEVIKYLPKNKEG